MLGGFRGLCGLSWLGGFECLVALGGFVGFVGSEGFGGLGSLRVLGPGDL